MPMSAHQLAALVERAKLKAPPVISPPAAPPTPSRRDSRYLPKPPKPVELPTPPPHHRPETQHADATLATTPADDFPTGWKLEKDSWHFHRRFYAIFRRPMRHGEYSYLLHQIRGGHAEHVWEDCWRVRLPGNSDRTLPVRATRWRLITILPKHWQPPPVPQQPAIDP
jgi:hypothetical protein